MVQDYYVQFIVHIQVLLLRPARSNDEIVFNWAILWWVVGQLEVDTLLVQLVLEFGIIDVAFHYQFPRLFVDCAI